MVRIIIVCRRLGAVGVFAGNIYHANGVVDMLKTCEDLERIMQKVMN